MYKYLSKTVSLTLISAFLLELYVIGVEQANYLVLNGYLEIFRFFSIKHIILFAALFFLVYAIIFKKDLREKAFALLYKYRFLIGALIIAISVILEIHGSSIGQLNISNITHNPLFGIAREIRSDEFHVNTLFAFSQYFNDFGYFSPIPRATPTDMFIVYGQPIWDLTTIYRPFLIGYLFLSPAKGLSFFWISRTVCLLLVSFEMGMLLTENNKRLSLSYAILLTLSPFIQWWFAINALVEMLIFGQLFILLMNYYMNTDDYKKRLLATIFLIISAGGFILTLYPAWEIPLAYVFAILFIWIVYKNKNRFHFSKKDLILIALFLLTLSITGFYILTKSYDTLMIVMNTVYPGSRIYLGSGNPLFLFDYIGNMFYPILPTDAPFTVHYSFIYTFFPMSLILFCIVQFYQKEKDLLLYLLMALWLFFVAYYLIPFPEQLAKLTLLTKSFTERLLQIAYFIELIILIRSLHLIKPIEFLKKHYMIIIAVIISVFSVFMFHTLRPNRFSILMLIIAFIILSVSIYFILNINLKKAQTGFLICVIFISVCAGGLVNPVESGADVYFEQPIIKEVGEIVNDNPQAKWVVAGKIFVNEIIGVGAPTLNSVNTYPNFEVWNIIDENNQSKDIYNRYAHIPTIIVNDTESHVEISDNDAIFIFYLNVNDLEKLNISYILTPNDLNDFTNENITFTKIYEDNNTNKIYKLNYRN